MSRARGPALRLAAPALAALALAGCSGGGAAGSHPTVLGSRVIDIYSSLPLSGPQRAVGRAIERGIKVALVQADTRAGPHQVRYVSLDDAPGPAATAANAHRAAVDPDAVLYIGDFASAASEVSMPILNAARLAQVSPGSTYVGLTTNEPGSAPGEPERYFPSGVRTFLRIVPRDTLEAGADLAAMRHEGCSRLAILRAPGPFGLRFATLAAAGHARFGLTLLSSGPLPDNPLRLRALGAALRLGHAGCLYLATASGVQAMPAMRMLGELLPDLLFYGSGGLCQDLAATRDLRQLPVSVAQRLQCTDVTQPLAVYPSGRPFAADYRALFGSSRPDPWAIYGYEAMKLALDTVASLGPAGNDRPQVLHALFAMRLRRSALGPYRFDADGDTTLRSYGLYRGARGGGLRFERTVVP